MKKNSALAYVGHNKDNDREENDFSPTPIGATQSLLDRQISRHPEIVSEDSTHTFGQL